MDQRDLAAHGHQGPGATVCCVGKGRRSPDVPLRLFTAYTHRADERFMQCDFSVGHQRTTIHQPANSATAADAVFNARAGCAVTAISASAAGSSTSNSRI